MPGFIVGAGEIKKKKKKKAWSLPSMNFQHNKETDMKINTTQLDNTYKKRYISEIVMTCVKLTG